MGGHGLSINGGIIEEQVNSSHGMGMVFKYSSPADLGAFFGDFAEALRKKGFKDMMGQPSLIKKGKFFDFMMKEGEFDDPDGMKNRIGPIYEIRYDHTQSDPQTFHLHVEWKARIGARNSSYGWYEFVMDFTAINVKDYEILEGNNKKVLKQGTFEFRNRLFYKNSIILDFLNDVPYVKNSDSLKKAYINYVHMPAIKGDLEEGHHVLAPFIRSEVEKHFGGFDAHH